MTSTHLDEIRKRDDAQLARDMAGGMWHLARKLPLNDGWEAEYYTARLRDAQAAFTRLAEAHSLLLQAIEDRDRELASLKRESARLDVLRAQSVALLFADVAGHVTLVLGAPGTAAFRTVQGGPTLNDALDAAIASASSIPSPVTGEQNNG